MTSKVNVMHRYSNASVKQNGDILQSCSVVRVVKVLLPDGDSLQPCAVVLVIALALLGLFARWR